jgi:lipoprotein-anchoring transpeptidase ErfK/SrfK
VSATARGTGDLRPRYGRVTALAGAVLTTLVTMSAGLGILPHGGSPAQARPDSGQGAASLAAVPDVGPEASTGPADDRAPAVGPADSKRGLDALQDSAAKAAVALPADSGKGRRIVLDLSRQRVWLVEGGDRVRRTYLVSGSASDNLGPGTYEVYSRSRHATGIDGSAMGYMVRFTRGDNAAIGFHDIPRMDGEPVQTRRELGTPLSHGCVRQARPDAVALWRFGPVGTKVVVTA